MTWEINTNSINGYKKSLNDITKNNEKFNNFRTNQDIKGIIESSSEKLGEAYYKKIINKYPNWFDYHYKEVIKNDLYGNPSLNYFDGKYSISTTTLRYVVNVLDIINNFDICDKKIVEVGGGYGGLARLIMQFGNVSEYTIIDLPESLKLIEMFLKNFDLKTKLTLSPINDIIPGDMFIANYSIAEFNTNEQMKYFDKLISKSKFGYFIHNIPNPSKNQLSRKNIDDKLKALFDVSSYIENVPKCENSIVYLCKEKKT